MALAIGAFLIIGILAAGTGIAARRIGAVVAGRPRAFASTGIAALCTLGIGVGVVGTALVGIIARIGIGAAVGIKHVVHEIGLNRRNVLLLGVLANRFLDRGVFIKAYHLGLAAFVGDDDLVGNMIGGNLGNFRALGGLGLGAGGGIAHLGFRGNRLILIGPGAPLEGRRSKAVQGEGGSSNQRNRSSRSLCRQANGVFGLSFEHLASLVRSSKFVWPFIVLQSTSST